MRKRKNSQSRERGTNLEVERERKHDKLIKRKQKFGKIENLRRASDSSEKANPEKTWKQKKQRIFRGRRHK